MWLPALPKFKTLLCARRNQQSKAALETRQRLKSLFFLLDSEPSKL
jgi:hypothetical protein